jgi:hypothetical protein
MFLVLVNVFKIKRNECQSQDSMEKQHNMAITTKSFDLSIHLILAFHIMQIFIVIAISGLLFKYLLQRHYSVN